MRLSEDPKRAPKIHEDHACSKHAQAVHGINYGSVDVAREVFSRMSSRSKRTDTLVLTFAKNLLKSQSKP
jgi:hypothetical protein